MPLPAQRQEDRTLFHAEIAKDAELPSLPRTQSPFTTLLLPVVLMGLNKCVQAGSHYVSRGIDRRRNDPETSDLYEDLDRKIVGSNE